MNQVSQFSPATCLAVTAPFRGVNEIREKEDFKQLGGGANSDASTLFQERARNSDDLAFEPGYSKFAFYIG